jgi:uncharacterized protein YndB with AHSA1/START domain
MKFQTVEVVQTADAPPEVVFGLIADPATWPDWAGVESAELERPGRDDRFGVGAIRRMRRGRTTGREEVVRFEEPTAFSYVLLSGLPVRDYRGDVTLARVDGGTRITWRSTFRVKVPFTGALARRGLRRFLDGIVHDLADHVAGRSARPDPA